MKNRVQSETGVSDMAELTDTELQTVSGGLNPQPLPPRVAFSTSLRTWRSRHSGVRLPGADSRNPCITLPTDESVTR
jgi:bacteriocin-like protein